jgi:hypothetical protein
MRLFLSNQWISMTLKCCPLTQILFQEKGNSEPILKEDIAWISNAFNSCCNKDDISALQFIFDRIRDFEYRDVLIKEGKLLAAAYDRKPVCYIAYNQGALLQALYHNLSESDECLCLQLYLSRLPCHVEYITQISGPSAITLAVRFGKLEVVQLLLDQGASCQLVDLVIALNLLRDVTWISWLIKNDIKVEPEHLQLATYSVEYYLK